MGRKVGGVKTELNPEGLATKLSPSEYKVAFLISEGLLDKQIAVKLGITIETVKHVERMIRRKCDLIGLDSHTRVRLARLVWEGKI